VDAISQTRNVSQALIDVATSLREKFSEEEVRRNV
jgi:hypothetical protein